MRDALEDPKLFGHPRIMGGETWLGWRSLLIAAMGEPLKDDERGVFKALTGREHEPGEPVEELWNVVGRRGGKTRGAAVLATYFACCVDYEDKLAPGEIGVIPVIAASTYQAGKAISYIRGVLETSPLLGEQRAGEGTSDTIRFRNNVDIEVRPASSRTIRSMTAVAAVCDEVAFWMTDNSVNPDEEILNALRPALATTGGPLIVISSPYARKGELWKTYRKDFGAEGDPLILVAKAASRTLNPQLSESVVKRAYARDPAKAAAEYGGEFRTDVEGTFTIEQIEAVTVSGVREIGYIGGKQYSAFVDPSGGSKDSMTLAVGHYEGSRFNGTGKVVIDCVVEKKPPFSPEQTVDEFCAVLKRYKVSKVRGDRYAGEWPRERFRKNLVQYEVSDKTKSDLYRDLIPLVNSGGIALPDIEAVRTQLVGLERRTARGGKDSIDHAPGGHDDLANAVAGAAAFATGGSFYTWENLGVGPRPEGQEDADDDSRWTRARLMDHLARHGFSGGFR